MKTDDTIVDKVLDNQATPEETREVLDWFETEEGQACLSQRLTRESMFLTDRQADEWLDHPVQTERMRERFVKAIRSRRMYIQWQWIAAVLIPFLVMGGALTFIADRTGLFSDTEYAVISVPCGEQIQVVLPDGTSVHLNSDSKLEYPKTFSLFNRKVHLEGEGYFNVVKDKKRPFVVDLKELSVKVTGTEFNVKAYTSDANIYVTLDEGGVLLQVTGDKEYPLIPGESATYNRQSGTCLIEKPMDAIQAWRNNSLNFYLTPLSEVIKVMERQYEIQFIVKDSSLLKNRFTFSTSKVSIVEVLRDLEKVSQIRFVETEDNVFEITADEK